MGVLGATSLVGACLLPQLQAAGWKVFAFTRRAGVADVTAGRLAEWRSLAADGTTASEAKEPAGTIAHWVCLAPIWVLPDHFRMLERLGAKRVVALSSTSVVAKEGSRDAAERALACRLADGESRLAEWARMNGIEATILRSTLIYGLGRDKNVSVIARFIRRFGFFPLLAPARGLRQPVHAADVASACVAALQRPQAGPAVYALSGGETLSYREMVVRIFTAMHKPARLIAVPAWMFRLALAGLRRLPRCRHWSAQMAERMNVDLVFDYSDAVRDLAFAPRPFVLGQADLPVG